MRKKLKSDFKENDDNWYRKEKKFVLHNKGEIKTKINKS